MRLPLQHFKEAIEYAAQYQAAVQGTPDEARERK